MWKLQNLQNHHGLLGRQQYELLYQWSAFVSWSGDTIWWPSVLSYRQLFSEVCDYKEIRDSIAGKSYELVLCHYPSFSWKHMSRGTILLYGHTHNSPEDEYFQKCLVEMKDNDCRHTGDSAIQAYNVGCMKPWMDYEPRSLQEIIKMKFVENGNW